MRAKLVTELIELFRFERIDHESTNQVRVTRPCCPENSVARRCEACGAPSSVVGDAVPGYPSVLFHPLDGVREATGGEGEALGEFGHAHGIAGCGRQRG